jgi:hypothetical protein
VTRQVLHNSFAMLEQIRAFLTVVEEGSCPGVKELDYQNQGITSSIKNGP